jgi:hypothetical protein
LGGPLSKLCVTPPFSINFRCQIKEHIIYIQFSNDYVRTPENLSKHTSLLENKVEINKYYRTAWTKKNSDVSIPTVEKLPTNATSKLIIFLKVYK